MAQLYSRRFQVANSIDGAGSLFCEAVQRWLTQQVGELPAFGDEPWIARGVGAGSVSWDPFKSDEEQLLEAVWKYPEAEKTDGWWFHRSSLIRLQKSCTIELVTEYLGPAPESILMPWPSPPLVSLLSKRMNLAVDGMNCTEAQETLATEELATFVEDILLAPTRAFPILVCSIPGSLGPPLAQRRLIHEFLGLAKVVFLGSSDDARALTAEIGVSSLGCPPAGARVYLPGLSRDSKPTDHPLLDGKRVANDIARLSFIQRLAKWLGTNQAPYPPLMELRDKRAASRSARIRQLSGGKADSERDLIEWRELAELADHENQALRAKLAEISTDLSSAVAKVGFLRARVDQLEIQAVSGEARGEAVAPTGLIDVDTVSEAVELATTLFEDTLAFLPSAHASASDSPFARPSEVLVALQALAQVAPGRSRGSLGRNLRDAFKEVGQDYAATIGGGISKKIREHYHFRHQGFTYRCYEHLKLGSSYDPSVCLRIYFCSSPTFEGRIVVGHVGRHLPTTTSSS